MKQAAHTLHLCVNGQPEIVRFSPFNLSSERMRFELDQTYGLDANGHFSTEFVPFPADSTEQFLMDVMASGDVEKLAERGLLICERPLKKYVARSLAVFDPQTFLYYTLGGFGSLMPDPDDVKTFVLKNPEPSIAYREYLIENDLEVPGTCFFTEEGTESYPNASRLGVFAYEEGRYHMLKKTLENEEVKAKGICTPDFIAIGRISNIDAGKWGFSIYRSYLTPEYLLNLNLFWDDQAQLKQNYFIYLDSKYRQLAHLHRNIGKNHGQPTNTNTLAELLPKQSGTPNDFSIRCQVKDYETLKDIPKNVQKIIDDGICPINLGMTVRKSPHAAAMIYDLQLAITQEFNVLLIPLRSTDNVRDKVNYILAQASKIIPAIAHSYGINTPDQHQGIINFCFKHMLDAFNRNVPIDKYNDLLGGLLAHALFGFSPAYQDQIEIV